MTTLAQIYDTNDIKLAVKQTGSHFFDKEEMRFFRSRLAPDFIRCDTGILFITSEQFVAYEPHYHCDPRRYTLRRLNPDLTISEIGDFQQYASLREARKAAKEYASFVH